MPNRDPPEIRGPRRPRYEGNERDDPQSHKRQPQHRVTQTGITTADTVTVTLGDVAGGSAVQTITFDVIID